VVSSNAEITTTLCTTVANAIKANHEIRKDEKRPPLRWGSPAGSADPDQTNMYKADGGTW